MFLVYEKGMTFLTNQTVRRCCECYNFLLLDGVTVDCSHPTESFPAGHVSDRGMDVGLIWQYNRMLHYYEFLLLSKHQIPN